MAQLRAGRKQFLDTIKLIAYRAESALVAILREKMSRHDDARSLVRGLFATPINLRPDATGTELRSDRHGQANRALRPPFAHRRRHPVDWRGGPPHRCGPRRPGSGSPAGLGSLEGVNSP